MITDTVAIRNYFAKLDLEPEIADIYLALHAYGPQAISELARNARVERTRIYRLIDTLLDSSLIEVETQGKRAVIKAAPIANLRILISQKEQALHSLQDELELIEQVLARNSLYSPVARVQFYYGSQGFRQMLAGELQAKTELVGYNYRVFEESVGKTHMEEWLKECTDKKLAQRILVGPNYDKSVREGKKASTLAASSAVGVTYRHIENKLFAIHHTCHIYDDIVAQYFWQDGEIYGLTTKNSDFASSQRQLFELAWEQTA